MAYIDKQLRKENKRRNIHLTDSDIYEDQLYNFYPNFNFHHILEMNTMESNDVMDNGKSGESHKIMAEHYTEMSTFPQTFDMDMYHNSDLELKKP